MLTRAPLTAGLVVGLWMLGLVTGSIPTGPAPTLRSQVAVGVTPLGAGHWWSLLSAAGWAPDLTGYLVATALLLVLVAPVERRLGAGRTVLLLVLTQVLGASAGLGLIRLGSAAGDEWSEQLGTQSAVGPAAAALGATLAASAAGSALWRRRVRLVLVAALVLLALYSGGLADVLGLSSGLVGLAVGPLLLGRPPRRPVAAPTRPESRVLVALLVAASALGPLIAAVSDTPIGPLAVLRFVFLAPPPDPAALAQVCADMATIDECRAGAARLRLGGSGAGAAVLAVLPVLVLLVLAEGLRRGRRFAWVAALDAHVSLAGLGLVFALDAPTAPAAVVLPWEGLTRSQTLLAMLLPLAQPALVAGVLLTTRRWFPVRAPHGTYRALGALTGATIGVASLLYVGAGWLVRAQFDPAPGLVGLVADLPLRFLPPGYLSELTPAFLPMGPIAAVLFGWTGAVTLLIIAVGLIVTFARARVEGTDYDTVRAGALVRAHGDTSLSYLATWRGNSYWFPPDRDSVVAYRVLAGVALTTGDPIGPHERRSAAVAGFTGFCVEQGWTPCFYSVTDEIRAHTETAGWSSLHVAEETVLALPGLAFTGKKWQDVRTALNRAAKAGITARWVTYPDAPLTVVEQIRAISEEWVADKGLPEMGFTLGGLDELNDPAVACLLAVDAEGNVHAVTSWLPIHRDGKVVGATLDFMRRATNTEFRGVMEFLIASAAIAYRDHGMELLSLSGAPLARLERGRTPTAIQRQLDGLGRALEPVYGFRSLLAFKAKFQPEYRPLFLAYPDPTALPAVATALTRAYLPALSAGQITQLVRHLLQRRL